MPFTRKHKEIMSRVGSINTIKMWVVSIGLGSIIFALSLLYYKFTGEGATGRRLWSQVMADAGMFVIGISFLMSGLTYFWDFVDTKIIYRKYLGLIGFYMTGVHVVLALLSAYEMPGRSFGTGLAVIAFLFGCLALAIFLEMAIISNQYSVKQLGNKAWRIILRTGYVAYFFVLIHLSLKKYDEWVSWWNGEFEILPPLSLVVVIFGLIVFGMRIALAIAIYKKRKKDGDVTTSSTDTNVPVQTENKEPKETVV